MAFCKFSSELIASNSITIENSFINEFMLNAPENCVKVYLYGLYKCNNADSADNNLKSFANALNLTEQDIISCFIYWEDLGLIQIISKEPFEIRYLPIKNGTYKLKKFNVDKYRNFNQKVQEIITGRMITPNEFQEYYYLIEGMHMEADALVMVIKYCVGLKGNNVNYSYIITVAKNWAYEGIKTPDEVENRLLEQEKNSGDIALVLKALGLKRSASNDEFQLYLSWIKDMEFSLDAIIFVCKTYKSKGAGLNKINSVLEKCYSLNLTSVKEISDYLSSSDLMFEIAKTVCKNLGVRYENLEIVVDTYVSEWLRLGFDKSALEKFSTYCFKSNIKTLELMNVKINQLFKLGLLTAESIDNYIDNQIKDDEKIQSILLKLGIERNVVGADRTMYKTWVLTWETPTQILDYAVDCSINKYLPMQYLNKILSAFHNKNIKTIDDAKKENIEYLQFNKQNLADAISDKKPMANKYSAKQLNSLFDDVFEVEI